MKNLLNIIENKNLVKNLIDTKIIINSLDCISIYYFCIKNNKLKEHFFIGLCQKQNQKKKYSKKLKLKAQILKEKISFNIFFFSPIILKIKRIYQII